MFDGKGVGEGHRDVITLSRGREELGCDATYLGEQGGHQYLHAMGGEMAWLLQLLCEIS